MTMPMPMPGPMATPMPNSKNEPQELGVTENLTHGFYPVMTPNGSSLPWKMENGVKVFRLVAEPLRQQFHLHGHVFRIAGTDGGPIPEAAQWPATTVTVAPGEAKEIEFVANAPGAWALHCHKTHHVMNGMVHNLPNMIGVDEGTAAKKIEKLLPGYMPMGQSGAEMAMDMGRAENTPSMMGTPGPYGDVIDMSGMFTILKVREHLESYADPGWYRRQADSLWRQTGRTE